MLLERYGFLGGLATTAQVGTICGLYLRDTTGAKPRQSAADFQRICRALAKGRRRKTSPRGSRSLGAAISSAGFCASRRCNRRRIKKCHGNFARHSRGSEAEESPLERSSRAGLERAAVFSPGAVVDCTGEATAAALAGATAENGATDQAPALVFVLENVDPGLAERGLLEVRRELRRAVENGILPAHL